MEHDRYWDESMFYSLFSYELASTYGFLFIVMVGLWLRAHGAREEILWRLGEEAERMG